MNSIENKTLFIFIDESGNFDFSPTGTKYYILTCVSTLSPLSERLSFLNLRYGLLADGFDRALFHACEDEQIVRNKIFDLINKLNDFEIDCVITQKNKTNFSLYRSIDIIPKPKGGFIFKDKKVEEKLYKQISETLLQYVIRRYISYRKKIQIEKVVIVFGAIFNHNKQEFIKKHLKSYFKDKFEKVPYIYFHPAAADTNCQIADYCGWAIFRKWEVNDLRSYKLIEDKIRSEFPIFARGDTEYYAFKI